MQNKSDKLETPSTKYIFSLLSLALSDEKVTVPFDSQLWNAAKEELNKHAILPIVSDYMLTTDIPEEENLDLLKGAAVNVRYFHKLMTTQTEVVSLLNLNNISAAVMKGAAAAQYYPKPELRQYGDIDILVPPADYRKAFDLLLDNGYKNIQEFDAKYDRHIGFFAPSGVEIELHRYFSSSLNEDQNTIFDGWLFEKLPNPCYAKVSTYDVPVFPDLENGLIILGHINQHLSVGLGFRQIIDWMFYC